MENPNFQVDYPLFQGTRENEIAVISFKHKPLTRLVDLGEKEALFDYLNKVGADDGIRVLVIKGAPTKMDRVAYIDFHRALLEEDRYGTTLERMNNAIGQFVQKLVNMDQLIIHVDSGNVILSFMSIGLACDYRIVADNTVFQNPNIELGTVPIGGGIFFISRLRGNAIASKILLSGKDIEATQALELGIVDEVVPLERLDQAALETAQRFAEIPKRYAIGMKNLLNFDYKNLPSFIDHENQLLRKKYPE